MTRTPYAKNLGIAVDPGQKRRHRPNQDSVGHYVDGSLNNKNIGQKGELYVLADGMGGAAGGETASNLAVQLTLNGYYRDDDANIPRSLNRVIQQANRRINQLGNDDPTLYGMGTTIVASVLHDKYLYLAHVGDSRAYLLRNGKLQQLSKDHTLVQEQLRAGLLTKKQAAKHPRRHILSRNLGAQAKVDPDLAQHELQPGDTLLLCSDGLSGEVSDKEIATVLREYDPAQAAHKLVDLANQHGGSDNISLIVRQVDWLPPRTNRSRHVTSQPILSPRGLQPAAAGVSAIQVQNPYMLMLAVAMLLGFLLTIAFGMGVVG